MFDSNPNLIQDPEPGEAGYNAEPLVLIHDGGGTIYSYFLLNTLDRPVYGIFNPYFWSGEQWPGGLPEMARHYARLIKKVIPRGRFLLGGWSLGGLLSLEVARVLAEDPDVEVIGMVFIDSVCPIGWGTLTVQPGIVARKIEWGKNTKEETKVAVERSFKHSGVMVKKWEPPSWEDIPKTGEWARKKSRTRPPTAILLRSQDTVPVPEGMLAVDLHREDRFLGWNEYRKDLFHRVTDIPGHHFSVFAFDNLDVITDEIKAACTTLVELARPRDLVNA